MPLDYTALVINMSVSDKNSWKKQTYFFQTLTHLVNY